MMIGVGVREEYVACVIYRKSCELQGYLDKAEQLDCVHAIQGFVFPLIQGSKDVTLCLEAIFTDGGCVSRMLVQDISFQSSQFCRLWV